MNEEMINKRFRKVMEDWKELKDFLEENLNNIKSYAPKIEYYCDSDTELKSGDVLSFFEEIQEGDTTKDIRVKWSVHFILKNGEEEIITKNTIEKMLKIKNA